MQMIDALNGNNLMENYKLDGIKLCKINIDNTINDFKFIDMDNGDAFVILLNNKGNVYGLGINNNNQLTNKHSSRVYKPSKIDILNDKGFDVKINKIICNDDASIFIDKNKNIWICGRTNNDVVNIKKPIKILYSFLIQSLNCNIIYGIHSWGNDEMYFMVN